LFKTALIFSKTFPGGKVFVGKLSTLFTGASHGDGRGATVFCLWPGNKARPGWRDGVRRGFALANHAAGHWGYIGFPNVFQSGDRLQFFLFVVHTARTA
jgi:hypothetical protein